MLSRYSYIEGSLPLSLKWYRLFSLIQPSNGLYCSGVSVSRLYHSDSHSTSSFHINKINKIKRLFFKFITKTLHNLYTLQGFSPDASSVAPGTLGQCQGTGNWARISVNFDFRRPWTEIKICLITILTNDPYSYVINFTKGAFSSVSLLAGSGC